MNLHEAYARGRVVNNTIDRVNNLNRRMYQFQELLKRELKVSELSKHLFNIIDAIEDLERERVCEVTHKHNNNEKLCVVCAGLFCLWQRTFYPSYFNVFPNIDGPSFSESYSMSPLGLEPFCYISNIYVRLTIKLGAKFGTLRLLHDLLHRGEQIHLFCCSHSFLVLDKKHSGEFLF